MLHVNRPAAVAKVTVAGGQLFPKLSVDLSVEAYGLGLVSMFDALLSLVKDQLTAFMFCALPCCHLVCSGLTSCVLTCGAMRFV